jgi:hypothetical protein
MMKNTSFLKKIIFLGFFICLSCQKSNNWNFDAISCSEGRETSCLIYNNLNDEIELEFLKIDSSVTLYINLLSSKITSKDPLLITIKTPNKKTQTTALIREGSQKICLNEASKNFIVSSLEKGIPISLEFNEIKEEIDPSFFHETYKKFLRSNSLYNKVIRSLF